MTFPKPHKQSSQQKVKSARHLAREWLIQALYQWCLLPEADPVMIRQQLEEESTTTGWSDPVADGSDAAEPSTQARTTPSVDRPYFREVWQALLSQEMALAGQLQPHLDRPYAELSPIERSILLLGAYELVHRPEIPYRVILNEAIELAKNFGGTDGHKYINGVLDPLALQVRAAELAARSN